MGMTIDESIDYLSNENIRLKLSASDKDAIDRIISAYLITKANYNKQLKTDMVAMLEDLKRDFIAESYGIEMDCTDYVLNVADADKIIQQKIDALKADKQGGK